MIGRDNALIISSLLLIVHVVSKYLLIYISQEINAHFEHKHVLGCHSEFIMSIWSTKPKKIP
jgi:hypothetical protein